MDIYNTSNTRDGSLFRDSKFIEKIDRYIYEHSSYLLDLAIQICSITSPTGDESQKANFVLDTINKITNEDVWIDEIGNVLCHIESGDRVETSLFTAHIDTVFEDIEDISPIQREGRVYAPSIWDNSVNVAGLIFCIRMLNDLEIKPRNNMLMAFTVGEEGLGNLKGIKNIMEKWQDKVYEVVALDGGFSGILNKAIGSRRYSIKVSAEGGHSWSAFGNLNAIAYSAKVINALYEIEPPSTPKTTYNAGLIKGGRAVNVIAQEAEFVLDFRSLEEDSLSDLEKSFFQILEDYKDDGIDVEIELLGERPCSGDVDLSNLLGRVQYIRDHLELDMRTRSGSTDANIPLSLGIPAVTFGVCNGAKAHTLEEYIEIDSLEIGIKHLAYFLLDGHIY